MTGPDEAARGLADDDAANLISQLATHQSDELVKILDQYTAWLTVDTDPGGTVPRAILGLLCLRDHMDGGRWLAVPTVLADEGDPAVASFGDMAVTQARLTLARLVADALEHEASEHR